jgi:hypothetical protein
VDQRPRRHVSEFRRVIFISLWALSGRSRPLRVPLRRRLRVRYLIICHGSRSGRIDEREGIAAESRFCEFWIKNTIRNVTMVVPVLITSCHVSEKPKNGPEIAQTTTVPRARAKTQALPTSREPTFATSANSLLKTPGFLGDRAPEVGAGEPFFSSGVLGTSSQPISICSRGNEQPASEFPGPCAM